MKLLFVFLAISLVTFSTFANENLVEKGCYKEIDKKFGPLIVEISIYSRSVVVSYSSSKHGNLGVYKGRIFSDSSIKKSASGVSVNNLTLNDGADGFIDNVKIEIKKDTVTFDSKNSSVGPQARIQCPQ